MSTITTEIDPPLPTDPPATFNTKAFQVWADLNTMADEMNVVAGEVNTNATTATTKAGEALASANSASASAAVAQSAAGAAGAVAWVSGTTYATGDVRYSPIDFQNYRRKTDGAGTTDPKLDNTNWEPLGINAASPQTFTNKTIEAGVFTNGYTEEVYAPAAGSAFTVDLANGSIQGFTTNGNTTITLPAVASGKSFQLQIIYGGSHTITLAGGTAKWSDGTQFSFTGTSGKTDIVNFVANVAGTAWMASVYGKNYPA